MFIDPVEFNNAFSPMGINNFYRGIVVDNADPKKLGRVKVSLPPIFGSIDKAKLPWCSPWMGSPSQFDCPEIGDELVTFFPFGLAYFPMFIGHWHTKTNHDSYFDTNYPNLVGFHRKGFTFAYNKETKVLDIIHPSGSTVKIDASGKFEINSKDGFWVIATSDVSITTDGEVNISGKSKTTIGSNDSQTFVNGQLVMLAGGGGGVCVVGSQGIGTGNLGAPVLITMISGSSKVLAPL